MILSTVRQHAARARARLLSIGLNREGRITLDPAEEAAAARISVIVAVHDAGAVTRRCLESLRRFATGAEVVLIDDASTEPGTPEMIRDYAGRYGWKLIRHEAPVGHSRSCLEGVRMSQRPVICLLNSDTVVTPWSWRGCIEPLDADATVAATGPTTSHAATPQAHPRARKCKSYWSDDQIFAFARQYVARQRPRSWQELPELGGFAFFIRREVWEDEGGFDPNLPDYGNESELCVRLARTGLKMVWSRNAYIHHIGYSSYGKDSVAAIYERSAAARRYIEEKHRLTPVSPPVRQATDGT